MASWSKAAYGGTTSKSGGGKFDVPAKKGNRGLQGTGGIGNSSFSRSKGIVTPTTAGNKGVDKRTGGTAKAPKD